MENKTLFDRMVFDRPYYRLLKKSHPKGSVPFVLAFNTFLWFGSAMAIGIALTSLLIWLCV
jgi:hypothetical protein